MTGSQQAVLETMRRYGGACPRDFANHDIYRYSARILELREQGYRIITHKCQRHTHRHHMVQYVVLGEPKEGRR